MPRILIHSHDSYGLGHVRRCSLLASALVAADPDTDVLLVTGSPRAQSFRLPRGIDLVTLPSVTKDTDGGYRPRRLRSDLDHLVRIRAGLVVAAVESFRPDVVLVDHAPLGMGGELAPLLDRIAVDGGPRLVLGLRDIVDDATTVADAWRREGVWDRLWAYDSILVYGDPAVTSTATELDLGRRLGVPVTHTGIIAPGIVEARHRRPFLLVTAGGGGDGHRLLRRTLDAVDAGATAGLDTLVVTGPLLSSGRRADLLVRAAGQRGVTIREFAPDLRQLIASATGVISMAGYNTVAEELAARTPALLVPRTAPPREQVIRVERLRARWDVDHCAVDDLDPDTVARFAGRCQRRPTAAHDLDLRGTERAVAHLLDPATHQEPDRART